MPRGTQTSPGAPSKASSGTESVLRIMRSYAMKPTHSSSPSTLAKLAGMGHCLATCGDPRGHSGILRSPYVLQELRQQPLFYWRVQHKKYVLTGQSGTFSLHEHRTEISNARRANHTTNQTHTHTLAYPATHPPARPLTNQHPAKHTHATQTCSYTGARTSTHTLFVQWFCLIL